MPDTGFLVPVPPHAGGFQLHRHGPETRQPGSLVAQVIVDIAPQVAGGRYAAIGPAAPGLLERSHEDRLGPRCHLLDIQVQPDPFGHRQAPAGGESLQCGQNLPRMSGGQCRLGLGDGHGQTRFQIGQNIVRQRETGLVVP